MTLREEASRVLASARPLIVGIGTSAADIESIEHLLRHLPADAALSVLIVCRDAPAPYDLPARLSQSSAMPVIDLTHEPLEAQRILANHVYVSAFAPGATSSLVVQNGTIVQQDGFMCDGPASHVIDSLLQSLAEDQSDHAIGIVLSGHGQDATSGLRAIKEAGGLTLAQEPATALCKTMPQSAVLAGYVDVVLPVEQLPAKLLEYARHVAAFRRRFGLTLAAGTAELLIQVCDVLRERTRHDFRHYKRQTLARRVQRRMQIRHAEDLSSYLALLRAEPQEAELLFRDLLIGVTQFFRDPEAFEVIEHRILPALLARATEEPLRAWVAGCATGEEAYTMAILLREAVEKRGLSRPVQVFATDVDDNAIKSARRGVFALTIAEHLTPERLERFFVRQGGSYVAAKELREICVFSQHDLIRDPPFSRIDLLSCRNVLIYFDSAVQRKLLPVLHYSLRPEGFLFLGPSEHVAGHSGLFRSVDKKHRVFQKLQTNLAQMVEFPVAQKTPALGRLVGMEETTGHSVSRPLLGELFQRVLLQEYSPLAALITERGEILQISGASASILELPHGPFENNIFNLTKRELRLEVRTAVHKCVRSGEVVILDGLKMDYDGKPSILRITVRPLTRSETESRAFFIVFEWRPQAMAADASAHAISQGSDDSLVHELENELRRTKEDLQSTIEELETSNEELKSSNEELLSINEELQSANEELQTSKEELQSVNEELQTVNGELGKKVDELNRANDDLRNLFLSTQIATIFLDHQLRVKRFTPATAEVFRLIDTDVGRPISDITAPFCDNSWMDDIHEVLRTLVPKERTVRTLDLQHWYMVRVLPYRTQSNVIAGVVATFVDVTAMRRLEQRAHELAAIVNSSQDAIVGQMLDGTITSWNRGAELLYGYTSREAIGQNIAMLMPVESLHEIDEQKRRVVAGDLTSPIEALRLRKHGRAVHVSMLTSPVYDEDGGLQAISTIARDITRRKETEAENIRLATELRQALSDLQTVLAAAPIGIAVKNLSAVGATLGNKACAALFNMPENVNLAVADISHFQVMHDGYVVPRDQLALYRAVRGEEVLGEEYDVVFKDGHRKRIAVSAVPLRNEDGGIRGAVATFVDVTAERQAVDDLQTMARKKDDFLALLGHELRNPLAAIVTATELLRRTLGDEHSHKGLDILQRQMNHMTRLVDDLLDVARVSRGKIKLERQAVDLGALLQAVIDDHRSTAQARELNIQFHKNPTQLWVNGDAVRLSQVFSNVLGNAYKFTRPQGSVMLQMNADSRYATVTISDTGIGMDADLVQRIFQPFEQGQWSLDRGFGGLGLGLALSRQLLDMHGGTIRAASDGHGKGSTFDISLPLYLPSLVDIPAASNTSSSKNQRRVLLIEDNADIIEAMRSVLSDEGHLVAVALDGQLGIDIARQFLPDVVLCDIGLPGDLDGYAVARLFREDPVLRSTYLVALTGYARETDSMHAREAGFDRHLKKPANFDELIRLLVEAGPGDIA